MKNNIKRIDATVTPETVQGIQTPTPEVESPANVTADRQNVTVGPFNTRNYNGRDFLALPVEDKREASVMLRLFYEMVKTISPKDPETGEAIYLFEYEANDFMDLKANRMARDTSGVHLPELERAPLRRYGRGAWYRRFYIKPYFFKWGQFGEQVSHGDTPHSLATRDKSISRQAIRNMIESEIVLPFVDIMRQRTDAIIDYDLPEGFYSRYYPNAEIDIIYPVPWFTGHEVGIQLGLNLDIPVC